MNKIILRYLLAIILIIVFIIEYNCNDTTVTPQNQQFCISGQIPNWNHCTKTLEAKILSATNHKYIIATSSIDDQGNFNICLPSTVSDTSLFSADSIFIMGCYGGNVVFNPPDARGTQIWELLVYDGSNFMGYLKKNNYTNLFVGAFSLMYVYVNKNVAATGWEYCYPKDTSKFDASGTSGWNKVVKNCTAINGSSRTFLYNMTEPSGGIWKIDTMP